MLERAKEAYRSGLIDISTGGHIGPVVLILKIVVLILINLSCVSHPSFGQENPAPKNVLIIMMDVSGRAFIDPFESSLRRGFHGDVSFFEAYLGESPPPTQPYLASMAEELRSRFAQTKLDLVIAVHPETLDFMIQYHDHVFPGVPIVYCGVGTRIYGGKRWPGMTGWTSPEPFGQTIGFALRLQPDTQAVAVLAGEPTNPTWLESTRSELSRFSGKIRELDILDPAGPDVLKKVDALPPRTVVLFNILVYRKGDSRLKGYDLLEAVSKRRPTYSAFESLCLNHGCIGGEYEDSAKLAESVAGTAARILSGESPDQIPPERNSSLQGRVDWQAFQYWNLSPRNLPPGTVVLNKPPTVWESYKDYVLVALALISLQALLIAGLLLQRRMRRQAENRLRTIFDGALEGIYRVTPGGKCLVANPALAGMLGYESPDDLIASVTDLSHDVWFDPAEWATYRRTLDEQGSILGFVCRFKRKGGEVVWFSLNGKRVSNSEGRTLYYEGFIEEITRLKRSEMELREREERLNEAEKLAQIGHSSWDVDSDTTTWSEGMYRLTGWDPAGPAPRHGDRARLYSPESWARLNHAVQLALATGEPYDLGVQIVRLDGSRRWARALGRAVCNDIGRVHRLIGTLQDITEQKLAEMTLRDSEERFRATFEQAAVGIVHVSFEGRVLRCNARFAQFLGCSSDEVVGLTIQQFTAPEHLPESNEILQGLAAGEADESGWEKQYLRKDGSLLWARLRSSVQTDGKGQPLHLVTFVEDITERKLAEERTKASEEEYRLLLNSTAEGIFGIDMSGDCTFCNPASLRILGYETSEEILGSNMHERSHHSHADGSPYPADQCRILTAIRDGKGVHVDDEVMWRKDGTSFSVEYWSYPVFKMGKQVGGVITFLDISARKAAEHDLAKAAGELQASEARHRTVFQTSLDALNISRLSDGKIVDVSKTFLDLMGFQRNEVIGRTTVELGIWVNPSEREGVIDELRRNSSVRDLEIRFTRKDRSTFWALTSASLLEFGGVPHVLVATRDISEAKDAVKMIRDLAFYDPLTHLPNRRSLLDFLQQTRGDDDHSRALLFVDLDNFKSLNDALGHRIGDLLLQDAAERLASCVRREGTIARLAGDEFAIVLEGLDNAPERAAEQARQVGEEILTEGRRPYLAGEHESHLSFSIGITVFGADLESGLEALRQGEIAIAKAKEAGGNIIRFFSPELQANVNTRVHLENELRKAVKAEEFELYFQPQVRGGRLIGSEALIRWNHPQRGILPPGDFIELAEDSGLILPMGNWALWDACEHAAGWAGKNPSGDVPIAVNISARQFGQSDFVERVLTTLDLTGANAASISLEITETSLVKDFHDAVAKMRELRSHGLKFSIDDFGTGYSSLAYLKSLPIDELKIDRAFVKDILVDGASGAIAQAIIAMGHSMGFGVIAEGVETEEQRDYLIGLGCDRFQGYLYSRPLPAAEFEQIWLSNIAKPFGGN